MVSATGRAPRPRSRPQRPLVYHLKLSKGDLPSTVLVPGDPDRAERIAQSWEKSEFLARHRQFVSYRGRYHGVDLAVVSSGIGGPAMSITVEELARLGVKTVIRVGSCGGTLPRMRRGDLVVSKAAVRFDGASQDYAPPGYPASADPEVYLALLAAARRLKKRCFGGITASYDTFYVGQGRPGYQGFLSGEGRALSDRLRRLGVIGIEMENATLMTLANIYGIRAGSVCAVYSVGDRAELLPVGERSAVQVANEAARELGRS